MTREWWPDDLTERQVKIGDTVRHVEYQATRIAQAACETRHVYRDTVAKEMQESGTYNAGPWKRLGALARGVAFCREVATDDIYIHVCYLMGAAMESLWYSWQEAEDRAIESERAVAELEDQVRALDDYIDRTLARYQGRHRTRKRAPDGPRRAVTETMRLEVFMRDGWRCLCCEASGEGVSFTADHIVPFSQGGSCSVDNLQTLCVGCNARKHATFADFRSTEREAA